MILLKIHLYLLNYRTFVISVVYSFLMIHLNLENLSHVAKKFSLIKLEEEIHDLDAFRWHIIWNDTLNKLPQSPPNEYKFLTTQLSLLVYFSVAPVR